MFLTRECDYAIRVVRGLADMELKTVKAICDSEGIPQPFAYKVLKKMERAGIVSARRGVSGGYMLAKPLEGLKLFDIVKAVDNSLFISECLQPGFVCTHNSNGNFCSVHKEFARVQEQLIKTLSEKSIKEIF